LGIKALEVMSWLEDLALILESMAEKGDDLA
jgi:hypothetical protein